MLIALGTEAAMKGYRVRYEGRYRVRYTLAPNLVQVLTEREEKNSAAIASNESFGKAHLFA